MAAAHSNLPAAAHHSPAIPSSSERSSQPGTLFLLVGLYRVAHSVAQLHHEHHSTTAAVGCVHVHVGMLLGRHRLFERISPKKSWEGVIGGIAACVAGAYATNYWFDEFFQVPEFSIWLGLSVVVAVFATFGDLVESLIKRTVGVKDSGHILPGHGGILDRIDSLLLVVPAVLIYLLLIVPNI